MALQFIFGNPGSGKSHYLYEHIIRESMKHPDINYIILVPEQFTMQTQKELVLRHPRHGIMNIDVLSFARLAFRVLEETGNGSREILDDEGKNLILRRLAGKKEDSLKVLKGNIKKNSFSTNRTIGYNSNVGYYNGDTFNYVNMNSRGILNSNMYNPNGL